MGRSIEQNEYMDVRCCWALAWLHPLSGEVVDQVVDPPGNPPIIGAGLCSQDGAPGIGHGEYSGLWVRGADSGDPAGRRGC